MLELVALGSWGIVRLREHYAPQLKPRILGGVGFRDHRQTLNPKPLSWPEPLNP